jgi:uncharacterized protein
MQNIYSRIDYLTEIQPRLVRGFFCFQAFFYLAFTRRVLRLAALYCYQEQKGFVMSVSRMGEAGILMAGLVVGGYLLGSQIASIRTADRSVQVRGSAELPVVADLATWALNLSASGNDLAQVQQQMRGDIGKVRAFLEAQGIKAEETDVASFSVSDSQANQYNDNRNGPRFVVTGGVTVRTGNLEGIKKAKDSLDELLGQGVVLTSSYGPNYAFTKLNDAKLELVSKATGEAYKAAEQFAKDSGAKVGGIKRASQGSVQVLGRDSFMGESEQVNKVLRVVTTVDYDLY